MSLDNADDTPAQDLNRRLLLRRSALAVGGLSLGAVGTAGAAEQPLKFECDLAGICRSEPCIGEEVCITEGVANVTIHTSSDGAGGFHFTYHSHWDPLVRAVGQTTGTEWTAQGVISGSEQRRLTGPFPQTITFLDHAVFTSDGPTENFEIHLFYHVTVNAKGEVTAFRNEARMECRG